MSVTIKTSYGELLDKITILQIKTERIKEEGKLINVRAELEELNKTWKLINNKDSVLQEHEALKNINESLWKIEDDLREKELRKEFDQEFIELARSVYFTNDKRAAIKKDVNLKLGSELIEEKSYQDYAGNKT